MNQRTQVRGYALAVRKGVGAGSGQHGVGEFRDNAESTDYKGESRCKAKSY